MNKLEIASEIWQDPETSRLLAEFYTGQLHLRCLEYITLGLKALANRKTEKSFTPGDLAHAFMALLYAPPRMNPSNSLLQALARVFLINDNDS